MQSWDLPVSSLRPTKHRSACPCLSSLHFSCDLCRMSTQGLYALLSYWQHLAKCVAHFCYKIIKRGYGWCPKLKRGLEEKSRSEQSLEQVQFELSESEVLVGHPQPPSSAAIQTSDNRDFGGFRTSSAAQPCPGRTCRVEGEFTGHIHEASACVWRAEARWICTRG